MRLMRILPSERSINSMVVGVFLAALVSSASFAVAQGGGTLSLREALAWALEHNPTLEEAAAAVRGARAGVQVARAETKPSFVLSGLARKQGPVQSINIPVGPGERIKIIRPEQANMTLAIAWPLWTGGRTKAARQGARANLRAEEANLHQAAEQVLYETGMAYFAVLSAEALVRVADAGLENAHEVLRTTEAQQQAGTARDAEVLSARQEVQQATERAAQARTALADAREQFNRLLGRAPETPVVLVAEPLEFKGEARPEAIGQSEARAIARRRRPEPAALAQRQAGAQAAIAAARAERRPSVSLVAQGAWQTKTDVGHPHSEAIGLQFTWPVLEHSRADALEQQARADRDRLAATHSDLLRVIELQAAQATRGLVVHAEHVATTERARAAAAEAQRVAQAAYDAGTVRRMELAQARYRARAAEAAARVARWQDSQGKLQWARALGLMRDLFLVAEGKEGEQ